MAKHKIGITEAGDAGIDLSWADKMDSVGGAVLITKEITPEFAEKVMEHKNEVILHATVTGWGGTAMEPNVPDYQTALDAVESLVSAGFPKDHVVIRADPIIPTLEGIDKAKHVIFRAGMYGFTRFRVSVIDMYQHVKERFKQAGITSPYPPDRFAPSAWQLKDVDRMLAEVKDQLTSGLGLENVRIEACAEPGLSSCIHSGCISNYDLSLLGLERDCEFPGFQRVGCQCYAGKTELLQNKKRCPHGCLYCYWQDGDKKKKRQAECDGQMSLDFGK